MAASFNRPPNSADGAEVILERSNGSVIQSDLHHGLKRARFLSSATNSTSAAWAWTWAVACLPIRLRELVQVRLSCRV